MPEITVKTILEIAAHEALVREAYRDSVGVWTWSIGITSASGHNVERYIGKPQPLSKCLEIYIWLLETKYAPAVRLAFKGHDLSEEQFAAALSFHYNTGAITSASWVELFRQGKISESRKAFMLWRKPKEIIPRRRKERDLFFDGKWSGDGMITQYPVNSSHRPDWSGGCKIDIGDELRGILQADAASDDLQPVTEETINQPLTIWQRMKQYFRG